jgi:ABC-type transport system involved in cytochrome c biogenesis permease subunit
MFFEAAGFVTGAGMIGVAWLMLLSRDRRRVLNGFYGRAVYGRDGARPRNALIWPSR